MQGMSNLLTGKVLETIDELKATTQEKVKLKGVNIDDAVQMLAAAQVVKQGTKVWKNAAGLVTVATGYEVYQNIKERRREEKEAKNDNDAKNDQADEKSTFANSQSRLFRYNKLLRYGHHLNHSNDDRQNHKDFSVNITKENQIETPFNLIEFIVNCWNEGQLDQLPEELQEFFIEIYKELCK